MSVRNNRVEVPADVLDQLRQMLVHDQAAVPSPPRFEVGRDEPAPWSVPPPGGFSELRAQLRSKRAS